MGTTYINYYENLRLRNEDAANRARVDSARRERDQSIANTQYQLAEIDSKRKEEARDYSNSVARINAIQREQDEKIRLTEIKLRQEIGNMTVQFGRQIAENSHQISLLRRDQEELEKQIHSISSELDGYILQQASKEREKGNRAQILCDQYQTILDKIAQLYPEVFEQENNTILTSNLEKVKNNIRVGDYDAAIGLAQRNITLANQCYIRLVVINAEFQELSNAMYEKMEELAAKLYAAETEQDELSIPEWSNGVFYEIKQEFQLLREQVLQALNEHDIDTLREDLVILINLLEQFEQCVRFAYGEKQRSECVDQTAVLVANAMQDINYTFIDEKSGFLNEDEKKPIALQFESGYGTLVDFLVYCPDRSDEELGVNIIFEAEEENDILRDAIHQSIIYRLGLENISVRNDENSEDTIQAGISESEQRRNSRKDDLKQKMDEKKQEDLKDVNKLRN